MGSMATGCVGAWRAISTGHFLASVQVMALAWLVLLATDVILLFGDGGASPFPPASRELQRDRAGLRTAGGSGNGGGSGSGGGGGSGSGQSEERNDHDDATAERDDR